jgi:hypothetical protein
MTEHSDEPFPLEDSVWRKLAVVLARREMGAASGSDVVAWATEALSEGRDSASLRLLAGLVSRLVANAIPDLAVWTGLDDAVSLAPTGTLQKSRERLFATRTRCWLNHGSVAVTATVAERCPPFSAMRAARTTANAID